MKAMIFAAGLGTRLRPITNDRPKAMAEVRGMPLVEWAIRYLKQNGVSSVVVNVHHFADKLTSFLSSKDWGVDIHISDERNELLDTGGGLKKASGLLSGEETFVAMNVDVMTDLNLREMMDFHLKSGHLATLAVQNRPSSRGLVFNEKNLLCAWENDKTCEKKVVVEHNESTSRRFSFSGIQIIDTRFLNLMKQDGKFSIIDTYLELAKNGESIGCFDHSEGYWADLGTPEDLAKAKGYQF